MSTYYPPGPYTQPPKQRSPFAMVFGGCLAAALVGFLALLLLGGIIGSAPPTQVKITTQCSGDPLAGSYACTDTTQ